jgi:PAS domain S-box-containing protein
MAETRARARKAPVILVVDDSPTQLEALRYLLEEAGYSVVAAADGKEGLSAARANEIDLVISDVVMPDMDGYGLSRALRADESLAHLPVILLTSLTDPGEVIRGLESGANHFICKPYEDQALLARVRNVLANLEIRRAAPNAPGVSIVFAGKRFFITADRLQILDMLLSTYENAVDQNGELLRSRDELRRFNERLETRVAERTAQLTAEIEERKRAEETLRESERKYRLLVENSHDIIYTLSMDGSFTFVSPGWTALLGHRADQVVGRSFEDFVHGEDVERFEAFLRDVIETGRRRTGIEYRVLHVDGGWRWHSSNGAALRDDDGRISGYEGVATDINERKLSEAARARLEEQLRTAQKMEAIGSLAGGVAHDFNNLLSVILSYTGFAIDGLPEDAAIRGDLLEVKKAGERAAALTRQLLAFGGRQVLQFVPLDLNEIVAGVEKMFQRVLGEDIGLVQVLAPDLGLTLSDPGQIEQVLMNLVVNARDAMPEGGKLVIETSNVEIDDGNVSRFAGLKPGPYVQLAVTDTGIGMDPQTKARIFEPFFTTKGMGKGTGLGMSTAYGIVKQSRGDILVISEPGQGTTMKIYLPREARAVASPGGRAPAVPGRAGGTETILVAEDEDSLREVARRTLDGAGYTVMTAADGREALLTGKRHEGVIHLLLTDLVMPRMSGKELAHELSSVHPALKVLYMSGYPNDTIGHRGALDAGTQFLAKPFAAADLTRKVREVLDGGLSEVGEPRPPEAKTRSERRETPTERDVLRALPRELLDRLGKAVIAARYDEIVGLVETIRVAQPDLAKGLRRMADLYDYDGLRSLLG